MLNLRSKHSVFVPNAAILILERNFIGADFDHVLGNHFWVVSARRAINKTTLYIIIFAKLHLNTWAWSLPFLLKIIIVQRSLQNSAAPGRFQERNSNGIEQNIANRGLWSLEVELLGCEAAERAMRSQEVDLSRLKGFHLRFTQNMRSGVTGNWWRKESGPLWSTKIIECVCVSPASIERANLFTLYLSDYEERSQTKIDQSLFECWIDRRKGDNGEGSLLTKLRRQKRNRSSEDST